MKPLLPIALLLFAGCGQSQHTVDTVAPQGYILWKGFVSESNYSTYDQELKTCLTSNGFAPARIIYKDTPIEIIDGSINCGGKITGGCFDGYTIYASFGPDTDRIIKHEEIHALTGLTDAKSDEEAFMVCNDELPRQ